MRGSVTSAMPRSGPEPNSSEKVPAGRPASATASVMARATSSEVPGWASWPLTTTGQPAASAEAVSPPATENASGKLEALNTATGPSGMKRWRMSGRGSGVAVGKRGVDAGAVPAALAQDGGEQPQLAGGAADLAGDAGLRQAGLGDGAGDDGVADGLDVGGDRFEELGALLGGGGAVGGEGLGGGGAGGVDVGGVAVLVGGLERLAGGGVEAADLLAGSPDGGAGDEHLSGQS